MQNDQLVKPSDIIFTILIIAAAVVAWFIVVSGNSGQTAVFRQNGEIIAQLPLNEDTEYEISGDYTNLFEIKDGHVRVIHTDCPNKQCEKSGSISASGASIVCAPNRVSVTIDETGGSIDAITG